MAKIRKLFCGLAAFTKLCSSTTFRKYSLFISEAFSIIDEDEPADDRFSFLENAAKNVQNKLINMAEEDTDSDSEDLLVGPGLGGQSNKPKKVA